MPLLTQESIRSWHSLVAFLLILLGISACGGGISLRELQRPEDLVRGAFDFYHQGRFDEAVQKLEAAILMVRPDPPNAAAGSLYALLAFFQEKSGNSEEATRAYEEVRAVFAKLRSTPEAEALATNLTQLARQLRVQDQLQFWESLRRPASASHGGAGESFATIQIAEVYLALNDYKEAHRRGKEALRHGREAGSDALEVLASITVSGSLIGLGRSQEAEDLLKQMLPKTDGNPILKAYVLAQLGLASAALNREDLATDAFQRALTLMRTAGATDHQARLELKFGLAYLLLGKRDAGIERLLAGLTLYEGLNDDVSVALIEGMIAQAYFGAGAFENANQHALRAADLVRRLGNRAEEARNLRIAGESLAALDKIDDGLALLEKAISIQVQEKDRNGALATFGLAIGLLKRAGRIEIARTALLTGLDTYAAVFADKEGEALIRTELARVYRELGFLSEALQEFVRAFSLYRQVGDTRSQIITLLEQGNVLAALNDHRGRLLVLGFAEQLGAGLDDRDVQAVILNSTAAAFQDAGDIVEALERYLKAVEISRQISKQHQVSQLRVLALFYSQIADYPKALDILEKTVTLARQIGNHVAEGRALVDIGYSYWMTGRLDHAEEKSREALGIFRAARAERADARVAVALLSLVLTAQGRYEAALQVEQEELQRELASGSPYYIARAYSALGFLWLQTGKYAEAVETYKNAIAWTEHLRGRIVEQEHRIGFFEKQLSPYDGIVDALYNLYVTTGRKNAEFAREAFHFGELSKARTWGEQLSKARLDVIQESIPLEVRRKDEEVVNRALEAYKARTDASVRWRIPEDELKEKTEAWQVASDEWRAFKAKLRGSYPKYAALRYPEVLGLDALLVQEGETLIVYKLGPTWSYAWVIAKSGGANEIVRFTRLPVKSNEIAKLVESFLWPLRKVAYERFAPRIAAEMFRTIVQPVIHGVSVARRLVIIPDGVLAVVPFEALVTKSGGDEDLQRIHFLGDQFVVSYYPSGTILTINRQAILPAVAPQGSLFAVGDPVYGPDDDRLAEPQSKLMVENEKRQEFDMVTRKGKIRKGAQEQGYNFERLRHSGAEVLKIKEAFANRSLSGDVLIGLEASEDRIKSKDLSQYQYLHFAVHGILSYDVPYIKEPALVLAADPGSKEDGFLTLSEIYRLKLNADMVTLSACETGLGLRVGGEGVIALSRAFMDAGARAVVVSLWEIADQSTALLMEEFYQLLNQGLDKVEALAQAKRHLRKKGYESPFFWAAFVLLGG